MRYSKNDILQMLISQYYFQTQFDPEVDSGYELSYETTISYWRVTCDLIKPLKLAKVYHENFKLKTPISELENLLIDEKNKTLSDFCEYISKFAKRQEIKPITLFGQKCQTASIFRTLKTNLSERNVDTSDLRPSTKINEFFLKNDGILFDEVNKLAPGTMKEFEYLDNITVRYGIGITFFAVIFGIAFSIFWFFHWLLIVPVIIGILVFQIGNRKAPEKLNVGGYDDFRELIKGMEQTLRNAST